MVGSPVRGRGRRWLVALAIAGLPWPGCSSPEIVPLEVFVAGSLMVPMEAVEDAFEARYPGIDLRVEGHGSVQVMRHVTEIGDEVDVALTADAALIPMLMYGAVDETTGRPYADWYVEFATNRLALAYTPQSRYAGEIDSENWYEVIDRPDVRLGLSDPRFDAAGYRSLMVLAMAQEVYDEPTLLVDLVVGQLTPPVLPVVEGARTIVHVPELLAPAEGSRVSMRGSSIQLVALLQSGEIDYAFEYESVVRQLGLEMVPLPDTLNLGAEDQADWDQRFGVRLDYRRFATVEPAFDGQVISYGATVPTNAPHPDEAVDFLAFLLGDEGRAAMAANHHPVFPQPEADHHDQLPDVLRDLTVPSNP
jgi:molybdate/tungstate transport system substrate-binding protein